VQDFRNMAADRGPADTDMRHQLVVSMTWQPDYYQGENRWLRHLANGWSVSPILKLHSGFPFTVMNGADANFDGNGTDRAQLVGDPLSGSCANGSPVGASQCWFNTAAFSKNPTTGTTPIDGTSSRNSLNQPAYRDVDLAIFRTFKVAEKINLQLRGEALNVFNMASLNAPGATVGTATFGVISSAQPMRQLQLGARISF